MLMKTLDEIAIHNGTDKATSHPVKGHAYTPTYELFFRELRFKPIDLLEIGVGGGESIQTWLDYFPHAHITGVDIVHDTNPWNTPDLEKDTRYTFVAGDQARVEFWDCFKRQFPKFDIVIDDGGHQNDQVIQTFMALWPWLKPGGLYCIEDLACAYSSIFQRGEWPSQMEFLKGKTDDVHKESDIGFIHFTSELAILKRKA